MQVRALDLYASSGIGPVCKFGCMFHVWHEMRFLVRGLYDCMNMYGLYECDIPLSDINMVCWFCPPDAARASCSPKWCAYRPVTLLALEDNQSSANAQNPPVSYGFKSPETPRL